MILDHLLTTLETAAAALRLTQRGDRLRAAFFREQVEPIHAQFEEFKSDHMATFEHVRAGLNDPSIPLETTRDLVLSKERLERETWMRFDKTPELARFSRADPGDLYFAYLADLRRCLAAARGSEPISIVYYRSLYEQVVHAIEFVDRDRSSRSEQDARAHAVRHVDAILLRFQEYCTSVETAYLKLRGDSLVR